MQNYLIFIFGVLVGAGGVLLVWRLVRRKSEIKINGELKIREMQAGTDKNASISQDKLAQINLERRQIREQRQVEILALLEKQTRINNNQVQKMLKVSDATATNYLDDLEKQGKIKQIGRQGRFVEYEKLE